MLDWILDWMIDQMLDTYTGPGPASSYKSPTISWIILYIKKKNFMIKAGNWKIFLWKKTFYVVLKSLTVLNHKKHQKDYI